MISVLQVTSLLASGSDGWKCLTRVKHAETWSHAPTHDGLYNSPFVLAATGSVFASGVVCGSAPAHLPLSRKGAGQRNLLGLWAAAQRQALARDIARTFEHIHCE